MESQLATYASLTTIVVGLLYAGVFARKALRRSPKSREQEPFIKVTKEAWQSWRFRQQQRRIDRCSTVVASAYVFVMLGIPVAAELVGVKESLLENLRAMGGIMFAGLIVLAVSIYGIKAGAWLIAKVRVGYYRHIKHSPYV